MHSVAIDRLDAHYRLPAAGAGQKQRLDRILSEAVGDILRAALERAGVPIQEEICIRSVHSLVRLRLSASDSSLAAAWSVTLAEAIRRCLARPGPDLVHYGSRHHALVDLLNGVARGDLGRTWAWRQMGLWRVGESVAAQAAAEEALRALASEPQAGAAALAAAARLGALPALLARTRPELWWSLARTALAAAGANADPEMYAGAPAPSRAVRSAATRILRISDLARAAAAVPAELLETPRARAVAVLAILEVDPASVRRGGSFAATLAATVEGGLAGRTGVDAQPVADGPYPAREGRDRHGPALGGAHRRPEDTEPVIVDQPLPDVRCRGTSAFGGLLFLVNVVAELGLADGVVSDAHLGERPLRWVLHHLGLALAPIEPDDPAALAFAGLGPGALPPSQGEEEASEDELAAVHGLRARVVAALRRRLGRPEDPEQALLSELCRRRAEIVADPGWVEIRLALEEASTEVRRAGLDLDPGWLPWIGVVMRFVYA